MWFKFLFLLFGSSLVISSSLAASGAGPPIKIKSEINNDEEKVAKNPLVDPIDGLSYRLPNTTVPLHYDIWLSTNIHEASFDFDGKVTIQIRAQENTSEITVHARQLSIVEINLYNSNRVLIQSEVGYNRVSVQEFLVILPDTPLQPGLEYFVEITYKGILRIDDAGFYRSSYTDAGSTKWLATTQFESTDARHAFPW